MYVRHFEQVKWGFDMKRRTVGDILSDSDKWADVSVERHKKSRHEKHGERSFHLVFWNTLAKSPHDRICVKNKGEGIQRKA